MITIQIDGPHEEVDCLFASLPPAFLIRGCVADINGHSFVAVESSRNRDTGPTDRTHLRFHGTPSIPGSLLVGDMVTFYEPRHDGWSKLLRLVGVRRTAVREMVITSVTRP